MELQVGEVTEPGIHLFTGFLHDLTERQESDRGCRSCRRN